MKTGTSVGSARPASAAAPPRGAGAGLRRRKAVGAGGGGGGARSASGSSASGGILRFYSEDAEGLQVQPTVVIVVSLVFIGVVIFMHLWGRFFLRG